MSTPDPVFPAPVPVIAGYWTDFNHTDTGHVFYGNMEPFEVQFARDLINDAFGNSYNPTDGFYATWDRVTDSEAGNSLVSYHTFPMHSPHIPHAFMFKESKCKVYVCDWPLIASEVPPTEVRICILLCRLYVLPDNGTP